MEACTLIVAWISYPRPTESDEYAKKKTLNLLIGLIVVVLGTTLLRFAFRDEASTVLERPDRSGVLVHEINLLERQTLGLYGI